MTSAGDDGVAVPDGDGVAVPDGDGVAVPRAGPIGGLGRTLGLARPASGRLVLATALGACAVAAGIALMGTSAWLISRASQHPAESALALAIVTVQVCGLSRGIFRYLERLVGHDAAFRLLAELRVRLYRSLEAQAPAGLVDFRRGDLLARMVGDVDALQDLVLRVVPPFAIAMAVGAGTVAAVWWMLPGAGAVLLGCLLAGATAVPWLTGRLARRSEARQAALRGALTASVLDLVEGSAELIAFGATAAQVHTIAQADAGLTAAASRSSMTSGTGLALTTLCAGLASWGGLALGVPAVHDGHLSPVLLAVIALLPLAAFELVAGLPGATQSLEQARRSAGRIFEVLDAPPPVTDPPNPAVLASSSEGAFGDPAPADGVPAHTTPSHVGTAPRALVARSVGARYPGADSSALRSVDLTLTPGRRVAVVGPSGAGKSTLAAVLLRFLPYERGSVTLGGIELETLSGEQVRTVVGLVTQDAYLFDTTVAENLRIGRRDATDDELRAVLVRVGLAEWSESLPNGLATEVGTRGGRLSGGQRQRLALARALLADFPVLVIDEPAEHLDPLAADALTGDLLQVTSGRSTLLITHRLAGLEDVDEVIVLTEGRVAERGTHDQLLAVGGRYAELWWEEMAVERSLSGWDWSWRSKGAPADESGGGDRKEPRR